MVEYRTVGFRVLHSLPFGLKRGHNVLALKRHQMPSVKQHLQSVTHQLLWSIVNIANHCFSNNRRHFRPYHCRLDINCSRFTTKRRRLANVAQVTTTEVLQCGH